MNVLILGGNGYLGSKVISKLYKDGNELICTKRSTSNISRLKQYDRIKFIPSSIDAVETLFHYTSIDMVINLACNYGRSNYLYDDVIEANIEFPLKVLNYAVWKGVHRFITIGTGLPKELNMYSFSKNILNEFGRYYATAHNMRFEVLKLEMFYGSDEPSDRFIPAMIRKMIQGNPVDVTLGTQHRDIISVEDVVDAIEYVVNDNILSGYNEIPVGTGYAPSISEIVDYVWDLTGNVSKVNKGSVPMRENEPDCIADISIMRQIAPDWKPVYWKNGIETMTEEIRGELYHENIN